MRDIKNGQFGWYEKAAMKKIEDELPYKMQASCKLIYIAICSLSASKKDSKKVKCFKFDIARYASVNEKTVQRYLPELAKLKIIGVSPQDRKSDGRYEKVEIWLLQNNLPDGQFEDSSETDRRQIEDTESDTINKRKKERKNKNMEIFEGFRKKYPGTKKGLETEWETFEKVVKKYNLNKSETVLLLLPALEQQQKKRKALAEAKQFVPYWKHLSTWLNNRCWTEEIPDHEPEKNEAFYKSEIKKMSMLSFCEKYGADIYSKYQE